MAEQIHIDFDAIKEIADKGVRRTYVFMGLGANAAEDRNFRNYELTEAQHIRLVPTNASEATITEYKTAFRTWIISCGLRELIETFAVFLDEIYAACVILTSTRNQIPDTDFSSAKESFHYKGLSDKLRLLEERFAVKAARPDLLLSINRVRHCFAHRRGVVGPEDCPQGNELPLKWMSFEIFVETPSGKILPLNLPLEEPVTLEEGGTVKLKFIERTLPFKIGTYITFSARELAEICFFVHNSSIEILSSAVEYAKSIGVPIIDPQKTSEAMKIKVDCEAMNKEHTGNTKKVRLGNVSDPICIDGRMKRIVKWFAFAGGLIPVLLLVGKFVELAINRNAVPYSSLYGFYFWPTSILLLGSHSEWDLRGIFNLTVSIFANVLLYAIIGLAVKQLMAISRKLRAQ